MVISDVIDELISLSMIVGTVKLCVSGTISNSYTVQL